MEDGGYHGELEGGIVTGSVWTGRNGGVAEKVIPGQ